MIDLIERELVNVLDRIHSGNSNFTEEQQNQLIYLLRSFNSEELSSEQAANYLGVCNKTFRNYIEKGWIPEGIKEPGKTKYWLKSDLDKWKQETTKKTSL